MDRFEWMGIKVFLPGTFWVLASMAATWLLSGFQSSPYTVELWNDLRWIPVAMLGWGLLLVGLAAYRLLRWQRDEELHCDCGGLLGREVDGRYGSYRCCLACGRNVNERYYR